MRTDIPEELRRALKTNERVPLFIDNLAKSLYRLPKDIRKETIILAVHDMTDLFINNIERKATERRMSRMEMHRLLEAEAKKAQLRAMADTLVGDETVTTDGKGNQIAHEVVRVK